MLVVCLCTAHDRAQHGERKEEAVRRETATQKSSLLRYKDNNKSASTHRVRQVPPTNNKRRMASNNTATPQHALDTSTHADTHAALQSYKVNGHENFAFRLSGEGFRVKG